MAKTLLLQRLRPLMLFLLLLFGCAVALAAGSARSEARSGVVSPSTSVPVWGPDFRLLVAPLAQQTSSSAPRDPWQIEKNLSLAVSPINRNFIVGGFETYGTRPDIHSRYVASTDGGVSWQGGSFDGIYFGDLELHQDSLVAIDAQGTAYYSALAYSSARSGYLVFTSTDGLNWSQPLPIAITDYTEYRFPADLAVDPRVRGSGQYAGSLYFASPYYHNAPPYDQGLHLRYSRDGGVTWSADSRVSDTGHDYVYRPSMAVASNGTVYVGFSDVLSGTILNDPQLFLDRSTDGGQTWGTDNLIGGAYVVPIGEPDYKYRELVLISSPNCDLLRINHYPIIGVSPTNPDEVYVTWNDGRWDRVESLCGRDNSRHGDIAFSRSTDGGTTWSDPIRVNDDEQGNGVDQWQPNMRVAPDGTIGITWYDRRYAPQNLTNYWYDEAYSQSTDGGLTWSPNQRVSDQSSDPTQVSDAKGIDDLGIRSSLVFGSGYVLPGWLDTRDAPRLGHIYVDRGSISLSTPSPTLTPASTPTRTPTSAPTLPASNTPTATSTSPPDPTPTPDVTPTACTFSFTDVPVGSTFYPFVHCLTCLGIVNGYPDGTFRPNNQVTRGQLSKIVANSAGFTDPQSAQMFEDVPIGSTFHDFIGRLASRGYIAGYACGAPGESCVAPANLPYFRPNNNATRSQISKIVSNSAGFTEPHTGQTFQDVPSGSTFYDFVERLASRSVMGGYPCGGAGEPCMPPNNLPYFRPNNNATRGQTSKIVSNTFFPDCNPSR